MTILVTARARQLAGTLAELKAKVRATLATELAVAVGAAVRDVLLSGFVLPPRDARPTLPDRWRDNEYGRERDAWSEPRDPWAEPEDDNNYIPVGYGREGRVGFPTSDQPTVSPAAAVAVGVTVGRWWLARGGSSPAAAGLGVLATALCLAGGPAAGAALAVLAAAADVLAAESTLARPNPF